MSTKPSTVDYIVDQISSLENIRYRKMFGEYALYCDEKVVALICDDQLFVKPTDDGRKLLKIVHEAAPYPGAKNYLLIDDLDDKELLTTLIKITANQLPLPKKKTKKD